MFDVFYLSHENSKAGDLDILRSRFPNIKHIDGNRDLITSYLVASKLADTEYFFTVEYNVLDSFNFDFDKPDSNVHCWLAENIKYNSISSGVKLFNTKFFKQLNQFEPFSITLLKNAKLIHNPSNTFSLTGSFHAFSETYREVLRLLYLQLPIENWLNLVDVLEKEAIHAGALQAIKDFTRCNINMIDNIKYIQLKFIEFKKTA